MGEKVHMFDDGKIRNNRLMTGEVVRVIPFEEFQKEFADYGRTENMFWMSFLELWEEAFRLNNGGWLDQAPETDFIVETTCSDYDFHMFFTRSLKGGWVSFDTEMRGTGAYLDVDHKYAENTLTTKKEFVFDKHKKHGIIRLAVPFCRRAS